VTLSILSYTSGAVNRDGHATGVRPTEFSAQTVCDLYSTGVNVFTSSDTIPHFAVPD
jgi:hypothetical protein